MFVMEFRRLPRKSSYSSNSILKPKAVVTVMQNIPVQHGGGSMIRLSQAKRGAKKHDYIGNLFVKEEVVIME